MPVSADKGHSQRVLEYRAGGGIVCFPWDYGAEDGWWWPTTAGVAVRTERDVDTYATPYVMLKNSAQKPALVVNRPQKIGKPGNTTPAGQEYWVHENDTRLCVSWWPGGRVYMRGVPILDGLNRVVAATIYGGSLVVMTADSMVSCLLNQLRFDGSTEANNAAMSNVSNYSDEDYAANSLGAKYCYYVSPKGSKIVVLSTTKIRTVTINSGGAASLSESDQPEPPDVSDLARWTRDDNYTLTEGTRPNESTPPLTYSTQTWTGGYSGEVSAGFTYSYQYGVKWSGESPSPVTMTITRQIDSSYGQDLNHYRTVNLDETAHYEEYIEYTEEDSSVITGLGADIEVYYKSASQRRDYVHDHIEPGNTGNENTTVMSLAIAASDETRRKEDIIRTENSSVIATLVHVNDESADNQTLNKTLELEEVASVATRYYPFPGTLTIDSSFYQHGDMTYTGPLSRNLSVEIDGNSVLEYDTSHRLNPIVRVQGVKLYCNGLAWFKTGFNAQAYHPDYPVYYAGDLFEHGFLRDRKNGAESGYAGRYAARLGKSLVHVLTEWHLDETLAEGRIFASDIGDASGLLDIPSSSQVQNMSVI